jgi:hypothetical protein
MVRNFFVQSVAELHHIDAAPAPTLQHTKPTFLKQAKVNVRVEKIFFS